MNYVFRYEWPHFSITKIYLGYLLVAETIPDKHNLKEYRLTLAHVSVHDQPAPKRCIMAKGMTEEKLLSSHNKETKIQETGRETHCSTLFPRDPPLPTWLHPLTASQLYHPQGPVLFQKPYLWLHEALGRHLVIKYNTCIQNSIA